jgi:hypothetical protein
VRARQPAPGTHRADRGSIRLGERDITGLLLCGEMYGAPYDLLAAALDVSPDRLRGIVARWRKHGHAQTGRLGPGPAWCRLTRQGMTVTGLAYTATRPSLTRLAPCSRSARTTGQGSPRTCGLRAGRPSSRHAGYLASPVFELAEHLHREPVVDAVPEIEYQAVGKVEVSEGDPSDRRNEPDSLTPPR